MKILIDTCVLIWWFDSDSRLTARVRQLLGSPDNQVHVSAVSAWEIATKSRISRFANQLPVIAQLHEAMRLAGFLHLAVTWAHGARAGRLPGPHKDPFDRIIAAQSLIGEMPLVTSDSAFHDFGVPVIW